MLGIKNRIIAVCCAAIDSDSIKYYMNYFTEYAKKNNYKILSVSYTHLDVYKRQDKTPAPVFRIYNI